MSDQSTAEDGEEQHSGVPDGVELWQVHIMGDEPEVQRLAGYEVEVSENEAASAADVRQLFLTRGGDIEPEDGEPMSIYGPDEGQLVAFRDECRAVGYFLHGCETNGIPEKYTTEDLSDDLSTQYDEWQAGLTRRDRMLMLMDYSEWRAENGDFIAGKYLADDSDCTWRDTGLSESAQTLRDDILQQIDSHPRMCYWTAQQAAIKHKNNHRVRYVEGLVLPEQAGQAIRHAWIEIDGAVAEVTWPWHDGADTEAVYFGVPFDGETVAERRAAREEQFGVNGALIVSDEELLKTTATKRQA